MIRVMSWNIRSWYRDLKIDDFNWMKRAKLIRETIASLNPDVICLQEALFPMVQMCIPKGYKKATGASISHHIYVRKDTGICECRWTLHWTRAFLRNGYTIYSVHGHWDTDKAARIAESIKADMGGYPNCVAVGDWNIPPCSAQIIYGDDYCVESKAMSTFRNRKTKVEGCLDYLISDTGANIRQEYTVSFWDAMVMSDHQPVMYELW